jgi:hypothetical protein
MAVQGVIFQPTETHGQNDSFNENSRIKTATRRGKEFYCINKSFDDDEL